ncbi:MAG: 16S rRNA (guanine(966)-N(2))-methyltransferase RsmD [Pseudomonadota bacterium]
MAQRAGNQLRIIGGSWRGRKLQFPDVEGLRPTTDRVRETLFNWLQPIIHGSRCLDLFAGSGALGLEALSRGATAVSFIDSDGLAVRSLKENLSLLKDEHGTVIQSDALAFLRGAAPAQPFDIVFLDPPFRRALLQPCLEQLCQDGWLSENARIYLEVEQELGEPELPPGWEMVRSKKAGQVIYGLAAPL